MRPLEFRRLKLSLDDRTDKDFTAPLRMYFWRSKSTLDSLMFSMNLGGNRRWVLLITVYNCDLLNPLKKVCVS